MADIADQVQWDQPAAQTSPTPTDAPLPTDADSVQWDQDKYGTPPEQMKAGLEGLGRGLIGPLAPMAEKAMGVKPEAIKAREETNPWTAGIAETVGLVAPILASGGVSAGARAAVSAGELSAEAAHGTSAIAQMMKYGTVSGAMDTAGEMVAHAAGLGAPATYAAKVGSSIVRQAVETAVMQSSDEASKIVTQDKNAPLSIENALSNIGLAGALGGAAGGLWTGAVNPLWKATLGSKLDEFLKATKFHFNDEMAKEVKDFAGVAQAEAVVDATNMTKAGVKAGPDPKIRSVADQYLADHKLKPLNPNAPLLTIDPERSAAIAKEFENMQHMPNDPKVRKAYDALSKETMEQYQAIKKTGLKIEPIPAGMDNPYKKSVDMIDDVRKNNHMWYYPTEQGFGKQADSLPKDFSTLSSQIGDKLDLAAHAALKKDLIDQGFKVSDAMGTYGGVSEPSFLVEHNGSAEAKAQIDALGKKYGQESVLHSSAKPGTRFNEMKYSDGRPSVEGYGVEQNPEAKDFTSTVDTGKFGLKFDKPNENLDHPLLAYTNEMINGKPAQVNDIFRIVHDYFGHAKEGFSFGPIGEENAWYHHMQMYGKEARKALTSETRGQNSWVNFGPKGETNRANPANTVYAEQKAGFLPSWTHDITAKPVNTIKLPVNTKNIKDLQHYAAGEVSNAATQGFYQSLQVQDESPISKATNSLGIDVAPVMKAAMSGEPKAIQLFNELREAQHPEILAALKEMPEKIDNAVAQHLGTSLEDAAHYSESDAGHDVYNSFVKEYNKKYEPIAKQLDARNAQAATIKVPDEMRRDFGGKLVEKGMQEVGTDSPYYKIYSDYAQRVMAKDDIGGLDKLKTEIMNRSKSITADINEKNALRDVRSMISDFQDNQIAKEGVMVGKEGVLTSSDVMAQRMAANKQYAEFSHMSEDLADHLGAGNFRGAGNLKAKLGDIGPEDLLKKFSPKGNVDSIPFLQKHFPDTLSKLQEVEAKKFLAPSIYQEQGKSALDVAKLNRALEKTLKGSPEYANFVLNPQAQQSIQAAQIAMDGIPKIKSSGTAGWISKLTKHLPASAMSSVAFMMGHNPVSGYILGELAQRLGKDVPEAMKLSYLKYLGSDKAASAAGFKAMNDMIEQGLKGHKAVLNATKAVLANSGRVLVASQLPTREERESLDKIVTKIQQNPSAMEKYANGQLGHYMPAHQQAATTSTVSQLQYLESLKPKMVQASPLDKPMAPGQAAVSRYNHALDIANNPNIVLERVKDGTIMATDIQDLKSLYPNLYTQMNQQLSNALMNRKAGDEQIPYKTRIGLSMFLGHSLDSTMEPTAILSAQSAFIRPQAPQQGQQPQGKTKKGTSTLGKSNASYKTTSQAAESDRSNRD